MTHLFQFFRFALAVALLLLCLPPGDGRGEDIFLPLPVGEGRGEGPQFPLPVGEGRGEGLIPSHRTCAKRPGDQIWVVSTRHLGCAGVTEALPSYNVQYFAQNSWHDATADKLLAHDDPSRATIFYVHGNRSAASDAIDSGWQVYHVLTAQASADQHFRLVIWSWPSDQIRGPIRDARAKAARTSVESYYLARLLASIKPDVPTSLLGYSFGARVSLGALHLAGGGELDGRVVPDLVPQRPARFRVAMIAAGADDDSFLPDDRFPLALASTQDVLNVYNPCDPALKRYRAVSRCDNPVAMGYAGIYGLSSLGPAAQQVRQMNVSHIVGKSHDERRYLHSDTIAQALRDALLFQ